MRFLGKVIKFEKDAASSFSTLSFQNFSASFLPPPHTLPLGIMHNRTKPLNPSIISSLLNCLEGICEWFIEAPFQTKSGVQIGVQAMTSCVAINLRVTMVYASP